MAKKWTEKEEKFLRDNFEKMRNNELAEKLDVSIDSIESKLRRLKLKRGKRGGRLQNVYSTSPLKSFALQCLQVSSPFA